MQVATNDLATDIPERLVICSLCDGDGVIGERVSVYEHGCAYSHDDVAEHRCEECGGSGFYVDDVEPDDDWDDDGYDPGEECGRWINGRLSHSCTKAGSEECDFECPYRGRLKFSEESK